MVADRSIYPSLEAGPMHTEQHRAPGDGGGTLASTSENYDRDCKGAREAADID